MISTRCHKMYVHEGFWSFITSVFLPLTMSHRATEQRHYCTKRKRFYSQFFPFISLQRKGEEDSSHWSGDCLWQNEGDVIVAGRSGEKEIEDLNVFFRPFLSPPSVLFKHFHKKKKSCRHFKEATFFPLWPANALPPPTSSTQEDIFKIWNEVLVLCVAPLGYKTRSPLRFWGRQRDTFQSHLRGGSDGADQDVEVRRQKIVCKERKGV